MADLPNIYQQAAARVYGGRDFAYIAESENCRADAENAGDTLFLFVIRELATDEDCSDRDTAIKRVQNAKRDLEEVLEALEALPAEPE